MSIYTYVESVERNLLNSEPIVTGSRPQKFRASGLPFCPVIWVSDYLEKNGMLPEESSMGLDFYAGTGTILHSSFQKWTGLLGKLHGNWKCVQRDANLKLTCSKNATPFKIKHVTGPQYCPFCKHLMEYEEYLIYHPETEFSGHIDCMLPYKDGFIVLDWKTTSAKKLPEIKEAPENYFNQINMYGYFLTNFGVYDEDEKSFVGPFKIYGVGLWYIARDNYKLSKVLLFNKVDSDLAEFTLAQKLAADKALVDGKFKKVVKYKLCETKEDTKGCDRACLGCVRDDEKLLSNLRKMYQGRKEKG